MKNILSASIVAHNQSEIVNLLESTHRKGIEKVIAYLLDCGFFEAPSSAIRHHNWYGGLAQHSLGVYKRAVKRNGGVSNSSIVIASLLHDICKGHQFFIDARGKINRRHLHVHGHGRRSYLLLKNLGLELEPEERRAIRWHMGSDNNKRFAIPDFRKAYSEPLYQLVHHADKYNAHCNN